VERIEPFVPPFDDVNALRVLTETAEKANSLRELVVIRRHGAAVAERAEILARVEAERREAAECSDTAPLVPRSVRLAGVLDERDASGFAQLEEAIDVRRLTVQVHGDQHASTVGDGGGRRVDVDQPRGFVAIDEDKLGAELERRQNRRDEGVGRCNNLVAGADSERFEAQVHRRGARVHADAGARADVRREFLFEPRDIGAEDVLTLGDGAEERGVKLVLQRRVLRSKIDERNQGIVESDAARTVSGTRGAMLGTKGNCRSYKTTRIIRGREAMACRAGL
jgi:hypothetical protein